MMMQSLKDNEIQFEKIQEESAETDKLLKKLNTILLLLAPFKKRVTLKKETIGFLKRQAKATKDILLIQKSCMTNLTQNFKLFRDIQKF